MRGSRNFCQGVCVCVGGSRPDCQKTTLTTFLVLNLFNSFTVSKKTIIFQGFIGGSTFSDSESASMLYDTLSALTIMCRVTKKEKKD